MLQILMASNLSDDACTSAQQIPCGSDLNLQKVVPKRKKERKIYFLLLRPKLAPETNGLQMGYLPMHRTVKLQ